MKTYLRWSFVTLVAAWLTAGGMASAHTISIGNYNAGGAGQVTIVLGTYDHGGPLVEGAIQLIAGPSAPSAVQPFSAVLLSKPPLLVDGTNNFYSDTNGGSVPYGTLASDSYHQPTNTVGLGPVINWMAATFSGLSSGLYTYQITGMTSANWNNVNSFEANWTGTVFIPESSVAVPEPASALLLGIGLAGMLLARRRRSA